MFLNEPLYEQGVSIEDMEFIENLDVYPPKLEQQEAPEEEFPPKLEGSGTTLGASSEYYEEKMKRLQEERDELFREMMTSSPPKYC